MLSSPVVFGPLPGTDTCERVETIIKDHGEGRFNPFIEDHMGSAVSLEGMFDLLHERYFPRVVVVFGPIYLTEEKVLVFENSREAVGSKGAATGFGPRSATGRRYGIG
jgi:hypothetical protein